MKQWVASGLVESVYLIVGIMMVVEAHGDERFRISKTVLGCLFLMAFVFINKNKP